MNKLLNPVSWNTYLETVTVLAIAYYAFIGWKYYQEEIIALYHRITRQQTGVQQLPEALQYQAEDLPATGSAEEVRYPSEVSAEFIGPTNELVQQLTEYIANAAGKPFAPAILILQLKKILNDFPEVAASTDREEINELVVSECEKTGTALLSKSEVDLWWSA